MPKPPVTHDPYDLAERMVEQAGDTIIFADRDGIIRRWNAAAAALFGFLCAPLSK